MAYGYHALGGVAFGRFLFGAAHRDPQAIAYFSHSWHALLLPSGVRLPPHWGERASFGQKLFPDLTLPRGTRLGELAEEQGHHPDIFLAWGKVETTVWTHKINGLTESDFILAARVDQRVHSENLMRSVEKEQKRISQIDFLSETFPNCAHPMGYGHKNTSGHRRQF